MIHADPAAKDGYARAVEELATETAAAIAEWPQVLQAFQASLATSEGQLSEFRGEYEDAVTAKDGEVKRLRGALADHHTVGRQCGYDWHMRARVCM